MLDVQGAIEKLIGTSPVSYNPEINKFNLPMAKTQIPGVPPVAGISGGFASPLGPAPSTPIENNQASSPPVSSGSPSASGSGGSDTTTKSSFPWWIIVALILGS